MLLVSLPKVTFNVYSTGIDHRRVDILVVYGCTAWGVERKGGRASSLHRTRVPLVATVHDWEPHKAGSECGISEELLTALMTEATEWRSVQDGQRILTTTPSVLGGCRAQVYRAAGATQWYTAVIVGVNEHTGPSIRYPIPTQEAGNALVTLDNVIKNVFELLQDL
ncbi:hypothetical protein EVAR_84813_1 [Eumeta japonica]|uniref:Lysine-specific demethylase 3A/B tudor domain-containing protein n=1 Tax=Eumeta variegata TaxID=151549 RepID=A0A4C1U827_EUMVA|nr:hypothetical protein EVAR_84813_1 [Eumeta japonica]